MASNASVTSLGMWVSMGRANNLPLGKPHHFVCPIKIICNGENGKRRFTANTLTKFILTRSKQVGIGIKLQVTITKCSKIHRQHVRQPLRVRSVKYSRFILFLETFSLVPYRTYENSRRHLTFLFLAKYFKVTLEFNMFLLPCRVRSRVDYKFLNNVTYEFYIWYF